MQVWCSVSGCSLDGHGISTPPVQIVVVLAQLTQPVSSVFVPGLHTHWSAAVAPDCIVVFPAGQTSHVCVVWVSPRYEPVVHAWQVPLAEFTRKYPAAHTQEAALTACVCGVVVFGGHVCRVSFAQKAP